MVICKMIFVAFIFHQFQDFSGIDRKRLSKKKFFHLKFLIGDLQIKLQRPNWILKQIFAF